MIVCILQGDMVDMLCWCYYGWIDGIVEIVFEVNIGFVSFGVVLFVGMFVYLLLFDIVMSVCLLL